MIINLIKSLAVIMRNPLWLTKSHFFVTRSLQGHISPPPPLLNQCVSLPFFNTRPVELACDLVVFRVTFGASPYHGIITAGFVFHFSSLWYHGSFLNVRCAGAWGQVHSDSFLWTSLKNSVFPLLSFGFSVLQIMYVKTIHTLVTTG